MHYKNVSGDTTQHCDKVPHTLRDGRRKGKDSYELTKKFASFLNEIFMSSSTVTNSPVVAGLTWYLQGITQAAHSQ